ncbi:MAG TPA: hypothetical protein VIW95_00415 [Candidatus Binatus sp.]
MLAAIELYDDSTLDRTEISEVRSNGKLTAELRVADSSASQMPPEDLLRRSLLAAEFAGCFVRRLGRRHRFEKFLESGRENKARREPESGNHARGARWIRSLTFDPLPAGEGKKAPRKASIAGKKKSLSWQRRRFRRATSKRRPKIAFRGGAIFAPSL